MKNFQLTNTKMIAAIFALLGILAMKNFTQSSVMTVQMELSVNITSETKYPVKVSFEIQGNKILIHGKNAKIEGSNVSFSADFQGAEIRFSGNLDKNNSAERSKSSRKARKSRREPGV